MKQPAASAILKSTLAEAVPDVALMKRYSLTKPRGAEQSMHLGPIAMRILKKWGSAPLALPRLF
ncbi:hypothetical protein A0U91_14500 (plasmid) [Acetobacter persici]|uniref:Uncharacterized protein n=1 Tax=Acetobacter persici TaxID=1076596 RepID=A0A1U9LID9_9PROT|nr:hypothetical protein A0U91_14500 [Acetobacter persici]